MNFVSGKKSRLKSSVLYRSASILSSSDRKKVFVVILIQIFLGGLDLVGVGLIGVIGSLTINGIGAKVPGDRVQWLLEQLQLGSFDLQTQVTILAVLAVSIMVFKTLLSMILIKRILYFLSYRGAKLSSVLVSRLLAQPLLTVQSKSNQETLFALTAGVGSITIGVLATFISLISDTSLLLVMAIGLFVIDPLLSATTFTLFASIAFLLYRLMQSRVKTLGEENRQTNVDSNSLILEVLASYRELVVKNRRFHYSKVIGEQRHKLASVTAEMGFMPNISKYVFEVAIVVGSLLISAIQFVTNDVARAVATLSIFFAASMRIAPAILRVQQSSLTIRGNTGMAGSTLDLIDTLGVLEIEWKEDKSIDFIHEGFNPSIQLRNVTLSYPGKDHKAVNNVSLTIKPGDIVALVGPSGAGKTSIIDLMLGIIEPDEGSVLINGLKPLDAISTWPGAIGYMPQDVMIANGTIRENVMLGYTPDKKHEEKVLSALKVAQLMDFVNELPDGLEQQMGDRGTRISGGQRQRLGIARAVFNTPRLLVLDEATSALDGITESQISDAIQKLGDEVTVVMIAHRLSTVLAANKVIYMNKGEVIAQGTFAEVRKSVPDFDRQAELMSLRPGITQ
jgi:ABC-type multidrug transport system fused ATPase/permease subunit